MAKLLVIDDSTESWEPVALSLRTGGHEIMFATNSKEGIERATFEGPDIVFVEMDMSDVDGAELCATLRESERTRNIPVITTATRTDARLIQRAFIAGAADHLPKPIVPDLLLARVESAMRAGRNQGEPRVEKFMTRDVQTAPPDMELGAAIEKMARHDVSCLVIVRGDAPVGAIDRQDALDHLAAGVALTARVGDLGALDVPTCSLETRLRVAAKTVERSGRRQLAIVDADGSLRGVITSKDFLRVYADITEHNLHSTNRVLERRTAELLELNRRLIQQREESERVRRELEEELESARRMQLDTLPDLARLDEIGGRMGLRISAAFRPCRPVGGDCWWVDPISDEALAVYVVDFTGHGVNAAMNTFRLHTLLRRDEAKATRKDPAEHLAYLNRHLCDLLPVGHFAAAVYGVVDLATDRFCYAACGATEPIVIDAEGAARIGDPEGMVLGVNPRACYEARVLELPPRALLALYTDAFVESADSSGELFSTDDLVRQLADLRYSPGRELAPAVTEAFLERIGRTLGDDLTLVCIEREQGKAPASE